MHGGRDRLGLRGPMLAAAAASLVLAGGCSADPPGPGPGGGLVRGPLCAQLPSGDDPGAPETLTGETADVLLTWVPVLTIFEAMTRAAGVDADLRSAEAVTILAPTDEAFSEALTEETIDDLILFRQDELRALLEAHLVEGSLTLADLRDAATVETLSGKTLTVDLADGGMVRVGDARTRCADYRGANARLHVIDAVLGPLPEAAPPDPEIG